MLHVRVLVKLSTLAYILRIKISIVSWTGKFKILKSYINRLRDINSVLITLTRKRLQRQI